MIKKKTVIEVKANNHQELRQMVDSVISDSSSPSYFVCSHPTTTTKDGKLKKLLYFHHFYKDVVGKHLRKDNLPEDTAYAKNRARKFFKKHNDKSKKTNRKGGDNNNDET